MNDGRKRISTAIAALGIAALGGSMLNPTPSYADPDIDDVQTRVDRLYHEAQGASERYNVVREDLKKNRARLKTLRTDLARQQGKVELVRDQVASAVVAQSQGQTLSSTSQVLLSENPDDFITQLSTIHAHNEQQDQMMDAFAAQADRLEKKETSAQREVAEITAAEDRLAEEKTEIDAKAAEAAALLEELEAEERARLAALEEAREQRAAERAAAAQAPSRSADREPAPAPVSGNGGAAVQFAMAQVGDAYVYGAAGPDAWDCSGLTMGAWGAAGVSLPHSSSAQMSSGTPVSQSQLQPGDLVFYYSPVSHVGMYIGNGQLVHAANPSSPVEVVPVNSMPYSGAVRPG